MTLACDEVGVVGHLDHLDQAAIGRRPRNNQAAFDKTLAEHVVDFVAVTMALVDQILAVHLVRKRPIGNLAGVCAKAHGAAFVFDVFLLWHQVDHGELGLVVELGRRGARHVANIAGEFTYCRLKAQANAQERHVVLAGVFRGGYLALERAHAESSGNEDAVETAKLFGGVVVVDLLAIDKVDVDLAALSDARMVKRLDHGKVRVGEADVLADHGDVAGGLAVGFSFDESFHGPQVDVAHTKVQLLADHGVEALIVKVKRHLIYGRAVLACQNLARGHVAELGDLLAHAVGDLVVGAADNEVGLDAHRAQLLDRVLRRLGLNLMSCGDVGDKGYMHEDHVTCRTFLFELARRLDERLAFNVANGAADLRDDDIGARLFCRAADSLLNSLGDVGDDLDGSAQEVAAALACDKRFVNGTLGEVRFAREVLVDEALVMAKVKVAFVAVVRDEDLAVLERRHGAGIDVQIRVHLLHGYFVTACFKKMSKGRCRDALAEG